MSGKIHSFLPRTVRKEADGPACGHRVRISQKYLGDQSHTSLEREFGQLREGEMVVVTNTVPTDYSYKTRIIHGHGELPNVGDELSGGVVEQVSEEVGVDGYEIKLRAAPTKETGLLIPHGWLAVLADVDEEG